MTAAGQYETEALLDLGRVLIAPRAEAPPALLL